MMLEVPSAKIERILDKFADKHDPCCAGCRWWAYVNSHVGECRRSAPVSGEERIAMLGMTGCSYPVGAGHVMTPREHHCGDFASNLTSPADPPDPPAGDGLR